MPTHTRPPDAPRATLTREHDINNLGTSHRFLRGMSRAPEDARSAHTPPTEDKWVQNRSGEISARPRTAERQTGPGARGHAGSTHRAPTRSAVTTGQFGRQSVRHDRVSTSGVIDRRSQRCIDRATSTSPMPARQPTHAAPNRATPATGAKPAMPSNPGTTGKPRINPNARPLALTSHPGGREQTRA